MEGQEDLMNSCQSLETPEISQGRFSYTFRTWEDSQRRSKRNEGRE